MFTNSSQGVRKVRVGIAGLGTVGGSIYRILKERGNEIEKRVGEKFIISKVINRSPKKYELLGVSKEEIAFDFDDLILNSDVVVEAIGGTDVAVDLVRRALDLGRIVVTPNKNLISEYGNEFLEYIKKRKLFFEASVGGGIPIISLLQDYLIFQKVTRIRGIMNGTTNYILTEMSKGRSLEEVLREAQELGYAEADPTNDIEGYDVAYKVSVLAGVVTGKFPGINSVQFEGITRIDPEYLKEIVRSGRKLKLIGELDFSANRYEVRLREVTPEDPFFNVDGVDNAIEVSTDLAGDFLLKGRGAGGYPTASAVIADLFRVAKYKVLGGAEKFSVVVMKFGGAAISDVEKLEKVAEKIIKRRKSGVKPVVVLSAMGDTTDHLIELAKTIDENPDPRELDLLLSTGEIQSVALMSIALRKRGYKSISFTGNQLRIITDKRYGSARIIDINTDIISRYLKQDFIPVVAGFQGITETGDITTLGRGGSDLTAIALAYSLGADLCELYKDVDGVYTADPRIVKNARVIKELSWEEMIELSRHGAQVLQARAAEFARKYGVKVLIKNAHKETRGTLIWEGTKVENPIVRAVTFEDGMAKVVLKDVPDKPGVAARIMRTLSQMGVNIDMIIQGMKNGEYNTVAFIVPESQLGKLDIDLLKTRSEAKEIIIEKGLAKVSIVGVNLTSTPEISATLFETLANEGINIDMISASSSRISVIIDGKYVEDAVKAIHSRFELDRE